MKKSCLIGAVSACVFSFTALSSHAATVFQVDKIEVPPDAYTNIGDQYSLSITGPITSTVTINLSSNAGCNLCNAIVQWGDAINNDPIMSSFLTATFDIWDGAVTSLGGGYNRADYDSSIYLTANTAGVEFFSSASVLSLTNTPKTLPYFSDLSVGVTTIVPAQVVPVPPALWLFGSGLLGFIGVGRRKRHE